MYGQFSLATGLSSILAYCNKSPRLILIQKINEVFCSTGSISRFGERFRDGQYSLITFLFFYSSTLGSPRAQSFVKVGVRVPVPYGVGATFMGQFYHTKKRCKTAIQSEFTVSQELFSQCLRSQLCTECRVILLTWFCKLLTRVAILCVGGGTCLKCLNHQWHDALWLGLRKFQEHISKQCSQSKQCRKCCRITFQGHLFAIDECKQHLLSTNTKLHKYAVRFRRRCFRD